MNKKQTLTIMLVVALVCSVAAATYMYSVDVQENPLPSPSASVAPVIGVPDIQFNVTIHTLVQQYRNGVLISESYHPMTLTTAGKDWMADKLFNSGGTNVTQYAMYLGCSANTGEVSAAWTALPAEITSNGLERALMTWTDSGTGTGNLTLTYTATGSQAVQLYGLYSNSYADAMSSTLVAAEQQGAGAVKNLLASDTLAVTVQVTVE